MRSPILSTAGWMLVVCMTASPAMAEPSAQYERVTVKRGNASRVVAVHESRVSKFYFPDAINGVVATGRKQLEIHAKGPLKNNFPFRSATDCSSTVGGCLTGRGQVGASERRRS